MKIVAPLLVLGSLLISTEAKQARIIGGQDADPLGFPQLAYLARASGKLVCTGTLVSQSLVLTSAHCRWPGIERVQIGRWNIKDSTEDFEERTVVSEHLPPEWDDQYLSNDLVLLELDAPVIGVPLIKVAKDESMLIQGRPIVSVGYGVTGDGKLPDKLQVVELDYVPNEACMGFRGTSLKKDGTTKEVPYSNIIQSDHMCTHFSDGVPRDFCRGDSGGPLLVRNSKWRVPLTPPSRTGEVNRPQFIKPRQTDVTTDETYIQIGIASLGFDCADPNAPGIGQRISQAYDFIRSTICRVDGESSPSIYNCGNFLDFGQYPGTGSCDNANGASGPNLCSERSDCNIGIGECCMYHGAAPCACSVPFGIDKSMCVPNKK